MKTIEEIKKEFYKTAIRISGDGYSKTGMPEDDFWTWIETQLEQARREGVESVKLEKKIKLDQITNTTLTEYEKRWVYDIFIHDLEDLKKKLLPPTQSFL